MPEISKNINAYASLHTFILYLLKRKILTLIDLKSNLEQIIVR